MTLLDDSTSIQQKMQETLFVTAEWDKQPLLPQLDKVFIRSACNFAYLIHELICFYLVLDGCYGHRPIKRQLIICIEKTSCSSAIRALPSSSPPELMSPFTGKALRVCNCAYAGVTKMVDCFSVVYLHTFSL